MQRQHLTTSRPSRPSATAQLAARLTAHLREFALTVGYLFRFAVLSVLALLFISAPISPNEVPHAHHRPASGL
jgi:hypothetical protein